ncbi:hypothetical protein [Dactylosporangium sp. NPDC049140]|uniref:hypothetical protein n=1 Tax=Dactylosporangium sp. NPDC049140 TaxID=3155647 RepID=UPI0033FC585C
MTQQLITLVALVALLAVAGVVVYRIAGAVRTGPYGAEVPVRCRDGHVFTTDWVPGVSFKAVRLGATRFQYCPVGRHWTFVERLP